MTGAYTGLHEIHLSAHSAGVEPPLSWQWNQKTYYGHPLRPSIPCTMLPSPSPSNVSFRHPLRRVKKFGTGPRGLNQRRVAVLRECVVLAFVRVVRRHFPFSSLITYFLSCFLILLLFFLCFVLNVQQAVSVGWVGPGAIGSKNCYAMPSSFLLNAPVRLDPVVLTGNSKATFPLFYWLHWFLHSTLIFHSPSSAFLLFFHFFSFSLSITDTDQKARRSLR